MPNTGWLFPSGATNNTTSGTIGWTTPTNIFSINSTDATASIPSFWANTQYLIASGFNFNVPVGKNIDGIEFGIRRKVSSATSVTGVDLEVFITKGNIQPWSNQRDINNWTTAYEIKSYGSSVFLWNNSFSVAEVNSSGLGLAVRASGISSSTNTFSIDAISGIVYYSDPATAVTGTMSLYTNGLGFSNQIDMYSRGLGVSSGNTIFTATGAPAYAYVSGNLTPNLSWLGAGSNTTDYKPVYDPTPSGWNGAITTIDSYEQLRLDTSNWRALQFGPFSANSGISNFLVYDNLNFALPTGSIVTGVMFTVYRGPTYKREYFEIQDKDAFIVLNGQIQSGVNRAQIEPWKPYDPNLPRLIGGLDPNDGVNGGYTSGRFADYGGLSDNWGLSLTAADIMSSGFGFALRIQGTGNLPVDINNDSLPDMYFGDAVVDGMTATIYYTYPDNITPLYVRGIETSFSGLSLYNFGATPSDSGLALYTHGWARENAIIPLVIGGATQHTSGIPLYIAAPTQTTGSIDLFQKGHISASGGMNLVAWGTPVYAEATGITMFVASPSRTGIAGETYNAANLFLQADVFPASMNLVLWAPSVGTPTGNLNLSIIGETVGTQGSIPLYIGASGSYNTVPLFTQGLRPGGDDVAENGDGYYPYSGGMNLYIHRNDIDGGTTLYLHNNVNTSEAPTTLVINGANIINSGISLVIPSAIINTNKNILLYTHGY